LKISGRFLQVGYKVGWSISATSTTIFSFNLSLSFRNKKRSSKGRGGSAEPS